MEYKKTFISELAAGHEVESPFLVLALSRGRTNRGGTYLNVELGDNSGRIAAKVWDAAESLASRLTEGTVPLIRGYVDSYRGSLQLVIREAESLTESAFDWADYLRASPHSLPKMKTELWGLVETLADNDFRRLVKAVLQHEDVSDRFYLFPAAKSLHHAHLHGLLEHSLSVGRLAGRTAENYPHLNADLLLAGALLHDLGKIWEFCPPPLTGYTTLGRLKGHLVMGCEFLGQVAATLPDFPAEKLMLLQHLILSHHGEPEYGAPVRPQLLEAVVLHHLDNIDAKIEAIDSFLNAGTDNDGWSDYHRLFGGHYRRTPELEPAPVQEEIAEPERPLKSDCDLPEEKEPKIKDTLKKDEGLLF